MGRGDGTFVGAPIVGGGVPNANQTSAPQVALADFMGIGRLQTLVIQATNTSNGTQIFLAVIPIDDAGQGGTAIITAPKTRPTMVVAADMNGDGKPDVVTAGFLGGFFIPTVAVLFNQGSGALAAEQDYDLPNQPVNIAVGDFNGDGRMDIAAAVAPLPGFTGVSGVYVLFGQTKSVSEKSGKSNGVR